MRTRFVKYTLVQPYGETYYVIVRSVRYLYWPFADYSVLFFNNTWNDLDHTDIYGVNVFRITNPSDLVVFVSARVLSAGNAIYRQLRKTRGYKIVKQAPPF